MTATKKTPYKSPEWNRYVEGSSLTYYIFEGILTGIVDKRSGNGRLFFARALSGGGGGRDPVKVAKAIKKGTPPPPVNVDLVNNPYATGHQERDGKVHDHGGPLPPGRYYIEPPGQHSVGFSAQLIPDSRNHMMNRGQFYIHGRGPHGSDGCIVPLESFQSLMDALTRDKGGILEVRDAQDLGFA